MNHLEEAIQLKNEIDARANNLYSTTEYGDHDRNRGIYAMKASLMWWLRWRVAKDILNLEEGDVSMSDGSYTNCPNCGLFTHSLKDKMDEKNSFYCPGCGKKLVYNEVWQFFAVEQEDK